MLFFTYDQVDPKCRQYLVRSQFLVVSRFLQAFFLLLCFAPLCVERTDRYLFDFDPAVKQLGVPSFFAFENFV